MKTQRINRRNTRGFTLVITVMLLIMLTVLAVGMLSLGTISLRVASSGDAGRVADANARLAIMMAISELQSTLGDDRRVTADASILEQGSGQVSQRNLVGVWQSAGSRLFENVEGDAPNYDAWKRDLFVGWLSSSSDPLAQESLDFARTAVSGETTSLFDLNRDGFALDAQLVPLATANGNASGSFAWAVSQDATRARLNLPVEDQSRSNQNDVLQAPSRPSLALSDVLQEPQSDEWSQRGSRVLSLSQVALDTEYGVSQGTTQRLNQSYSANARGVLANVVDGGLKTDLSLAFELGDNDFRSSSWDGYANPFRDGNNEVPLYLPSRRTNNASPVKVAFNYFNSGRNPTYPVGAPPTFDTLRSFYRTYKHVYNSGGTATAFTRPHASSYWASSSLDLPAPRGSEPSITPVLDRVIYFINLWVDPSSSRLHCVLTPVITLWNPYDVAIESNGYVAYPSMDLPLYLNLRINGADRGGLYFSQIAGINQFNNGEGRQDVPYFYCSLTENGDGDFTRNLRLEPGEIRAFVPTDTTPQVFQRSFDSSFASSASPTVAQKNADYQRRLLHMMPVRSGGDYSATRGGMAFDLQNTIGNNFSEPNRLTMQDTDTASMRVTINSNDYNYFVTLEDGGRALGRREYVINEVQRQRGQASTSVLEWSAAVSAGNLKAAQRTLGLLETYHITANGTGTQSDLVYTVNPRQRYINTAFSNTNYAAAPHYNADIRTGGQEQLEINNGQAFYGASNSSSSGSAHLSFYEVPKEPAMSLGFFQSADLADNAFAPGAQFGNSNASPYVEAAAVSTELRSARFGGYSFDPRFALYDHSYLVNERMWDRYYFSSIAPVTQRRNGSGSSNSYDNEQVSTVRSLNTVIDEWVESPDLNPLRNPRHTLHLAGFPKEEVKNRLSGNGGAFHAASHILVDGVFNVNSTDVEAWKAMLASLRGASFDVTSEDGSGESRHDAGSQTPVSRFRDPIGNAGDPWNGFRELNDSDIERLAENIVEQVKERGPFQSLGEFVNRRVGSGDLALKGALQAAIDDSGINNSIAVKTFNTSGYPQPANITTPDTAAGIPGWVMQADLLNALAPFINVRSDTFTIRGYGEAHDKNGRVIARSWCEAVVQRIPEWVSPENDPSDTINSLSPVNQTFGRRFEIVSFRRLSPNEQTSSAS